MAKAYQYTADGYYAGEIEDYGLLPNNATRTAPTVVDGKVPRWTGSKWEQVEDHKGKSGYVNGQPHTINAYGPLPEGWSTEPPAPTLEDQLAAIEAKYASKIASLREAITSAYLIDGEIMDSNVAGLRAEWASVIAQRNAEMEALLI